MSAEHGAADGGRGVAVAVVVDGRQDRRFELAAQAQRAVEGDGQGLLADPALAEGRERHFGRYVADRQSTRLLDLGKGLFVVLIGVQLRHRVVDGRGETYADQQVADHARHKPRRQVAAGMAVRETPQLDAPGERVAQA